MGQLIVTNPFDAAPVGEVKLSPKATLIWH